MVGFGVPALLTAAAAIAQDFGSAGGWYYGAVVQLYKQGTLTHCCFVDYRCWIINHHSFVQLIISNLFLGVILVAVCVTYCAIAVCIIATASLPHPHRLTQILSSAGDSSSVCQAQWADQLCRSSEKGAVAECRYHSSQCNHNVLRPQILRLGAYPLVFLLVWLLPAITRLTPRDNDDGNRPPTLCWFVRFV